MSVKEQPESLPQFVLFGNLIDESRAEIRDMVNEICHENGYESWETCLVLPRWNDLVVYSRSREFTQRAVA